MWECTTTAATVSYVNICLGQKMKKSIRQVIGQGINQGANQGVKAALVSVFVIAALCSQTSWSAGVMVEHAWSLPMPPVARNGAAYFAIKNHGSTDKLIGARSDIADEVQIHTIVHIEGQMKMQLLSSVEVPMHGSINFEPGGMHLMLLGLKEPLEEGGHYLLRLTFEKAGEVDVMVMVKMNTEDGMSSSEHSDHNNSAD